MKGILLQILIPQFLAIGRSLAVWLAVKDDNDTGGDDIAARAVNHAITEVETYFKSKEFRTP
jgi:hypothetical protein